MDDVAITIGLNCVHSVCVLFCQNYFLYQVGFVRQETQEHSKILHYLIWLSKFCTSDFDCIWRCVVEVNQLVPRVSVRIIKKLIWPLIGAFDFCCFGSQYDWVRRHRLIFIQSFVCPQFLHECFEGLLNLFITADDRIWMVHSFFSGVDVKLPTQRIFGFCFLLSANPTSHYFLFQNHTIIYLRSQTKHYHYVSSCCLYYKLSFSINHSILSPAAFIFLFNLCFSPLEFIFLSDSRIFETSGDWEPICSMIISFIILSVFFYYSCFCFLFSVLVTNLSFSFCQVLSTIAVEALLRFFSIGADLFYSFWPFLRNWALFLGLIFLAFFAMLILLSN